MTKPTIVLEKSPIKSRARKYLARGEWKKALREFQHLVRSDPTDFRACLKVGDLLQKLGKSDEAVTQYKALAHRYMAEGFFIQALSLSKIVRRIDPPSRLLTIALSGFRIQEWGDAMGNGSSTLRVLITYVILMIVGQAMAVGIGLLLDPFSKTAALATFIPLYYGMYWVAWRGALMIADRTPATADSGSTARIATWLLAPAVLALDMAE